MFDALRSPNCDSLNRATDSLIYYYICTPCWVPHRVVGVKLGSLDQDQRMPEAVCHLYMCEI